MALSASILDLAAGDNWRLRHTVGTVEKPIPNGLTITGASFHLATTAAGLDTGRLITKDITTANQAAGQIEDDNSDNGGTGVLRFDVLQAETALTPARPYFYRFRVTYSNGLTVTSQKGMLIPQ